MILLLSAISSSAQPILVGVEPILSGPQAPFGVQSLDAVKLAVNQINAQGGVLGRPIELVVQDQGTTSSSLLTATHILVSQDGVSYIIDTTNSGGVQSEASYLYQSKVIELQVSASLDALMVPPDNTYMWRLNTGDSAAALVTLQWLNMVGAKSVVFQSEDFSYAHEIVSEFQNDTTAANSSITVQSADYYPVTTTDYSAAIANTIIASYEFSEYSDRGWL